MIKVTPATLPAYIEEFAQILGKTFVVSELDSFRTHGLRRAEARMVEASAHPLALWWQTLKHDAEVSKKENTLRLSDGSIRALRLFSDLKDIKRIPNCERIINAIRKRATFYSACFEAYIAASYAAKGYEVEITDENRDQGRTSDLRVIGEDLQVVYVECKCLDDIKIKEERHWDELLERLEKALRMHHRSWAVIIRSSLTIGAKEKEDIITTVSYSSRTGDMAPQRCADGRILIEYMKLWEWDQIMPGPIGFTKMGETGVFSVAAIHDGQRMLAKNPVAIAAFPYTEVNISSRLINEFKRASRQIPKEGPGIIHIAIPHKAGNQLLNVIDHCYPYVYRTINKDSRRVNAVVISASLVSGGNRPGESALVYQHYVIPNLHARTRLPKWYSILGAHDMGIPMPDKEGTIEIVFTPRERCYPGRAAIIYDHCSNDGRYQLRFWYAWNDRVRFDLVTPSLGRAFVDSDESNLEPNKRYYLAGRWSKNEVTLFINGKPRGKHILNT